jgi:transcriptional regulator GlxA family with amidase domain
MRIQILLLDGFDELDALGALEVLHAAAGAGAELRAELVRLDSATVTSAFGLQLHVATRLEADEPPALLLLPGAAWLANAGRGTWAARQRDRVAALVAALHRNGATLAAVRTGAAVLGAAGLLRGRAATTDHQAIDELRAHGAEIVPERVVDEGDVVTCGGMASGLDLAFWLVERYASPAVAQAVERQLGYERRGTVWRRSGSHPPSH